MWAIFEAVLMFILLFCLVLILGALLEVGTWLLAGGVIVAAPLCLVIFGYSLGKRRK